jgi:hypothetical protein
MSNLFDFEEKPDSKKPYEIAHARGFDIHSALSKSGEFDALEKAFMENIKNNFAELDTLLKKANSIYIDGIYRLYHQSFKVYGLREFTLEFEAAILKLRPDDRLPLNAYLAEILKDSKEIGEWKPEHNNDWLSHTRPIVEAFLHAKYLLEMLIKYANIEQTNILPSGWAAVLYMFYLR